MKGLGLCYMGKVDRLAVEAKVKASISMLETLTVTKSASDLRWSRDILINLLLVSVFQCEKWLALRAVLTPPLPLSLPFPVLEALYLLPSSPTQKVHFWPYCPSQTQS